MTKRILVALSGTPYTSAAIRRAVELAQLHQASVTGVTIVDREMIEDVGPIPLGGGSSAAELRAHRLAVTQAHLDEVVAQFQAAADAAHVTSRVVHETGDPMDKLISLWRYHDLTVFDLRGLFDYGVVHHPDDEVIRLIAHGVRPIIAVAQRDRAVQRAVIAYNGSWESAKAMKTFVQLRPWPEPELMIVCFDPDLAKGRQLVEDAASYCRDHSLKATAHAEPGDARHALLPWAAQHRADLIVLGATSRKRIFQNMLGDTVHHLLKNAEVPLFLTQ